MFNTKISTRKPGADVRGISVPLTLRMGGMDAIKARKGRASIVAIQRWQCTFISKSYRRVRP